jgi:uncharacterized protein (DUF924 family)
MSRVDAILNYWFGPDLDAPGIMTIRKPFWFAGPEYSDRIDAYCKKMYGADYEAAVSGKLVIEPHDVRGRLALLIMLDQFTRNLFRGTPGAFTQDAKAVALTREGIARGDDRKLKCVERYFFYMPLMHGETPELQDEALVQFTQLVIDSPPDQKEEFEKLLGKAKMQHRAVHKFGRYPHRNKILGRVSTPEEIEFLATEDQPGRGAKGAPPPETYGG